MLSGCSSRVGPAVPLKLAGPAQLIGNLVAALRLKGAVCNDDDARTFGAPRKRSMLDEDSLVARGPRAAKLARSLAKWTCYGGAFSLIASLISYHRAHAFCGLATLLYATVLLLARQTGNGDGASASRQDVSLALAAASSFMLIELTTLMPRPDQSLGEWTILVHLFAAALEGYAIVFTFGMCEAGENQHAAAGADMV